MDGNNQFLHFSNISPRSAGREVTAAQADAFRDAVNAKIADDFAPAVDQEFGMCNRAETTYRLSNDLELICTNADGNVRVTLERAAIDSGALCLSTIMSLDEPLRMEQLPGYTDPWRGKLEAWRASADYPLIRRRFAEVMALLNQLGPHNCMSPLNPQQRKTFIEAIQARIPCDYHIDIPDPPSSLWGGLGGLPMPDALNAPASPPDRSNPSLLKEASYVVGDVLLRCAMRADMQSRTQLAILDIQKAAECDAPAITKLTATQSYGVIPSTYDYYSADVMAEYADREGSAYKCIWDTYRSPERLKRELESPMDDMVPQPDAVFTQAQYVQTMKWLSRITQEGTLVDL